MGAVRGRAGSALTSNSNIATPLPRIINQVSQGLRYFRPHPVSNHLTTDTWSICSISMERRNSHPERSIGK